MSPKTAIEWNDEGVILYQDKKYEDAITAFLKAIELDNSNPIFFKNLGDVYYDSGKTEDAFHNYRMALKMDENNPNFLLDYAIILHAENQDRLAITHLLKALESEPENIEILYQVVLTYYSLNEIALATKYCQRLLKIQPNHQDGLLILARCYLDQKNIPFAEKILDMLLKISPQYARALYLRAQIYRQQDNLVKASEFTLAAYQSDKDNSSIIESLFSYYEHAYLYGRIFSIVNRYREDHPIVAEKLKNFPKAGQVLLDYYELGLEFRQALKIETEDSDYDVKIRQSQELVEMINIFLDNLDTQSQEDPEEDASKLLKAILFFTRKSFDLARDILSRMFGKLESELFYFLIGSVWLLYGSYEQSFKIWKTFVKIGKEDGTVYLFYAYCALKLNQNELAEEFLQKSHNLQTELRIFFPKLDAFDDSNILDDFFGLAIRKIISFFKKTE
jgi:tetratricopeptide (TPR) repeat protein